MIQIMYEYPERWPEQGPLAIKAPSIDLQIPVSPETARRRANGYLGLNVGILLGADEPVLVLSQPPVWRLKVNLHLPHMGKVGQVGIIEVNALTGQVVPITVAQNQSIQEAARDLATRYTPETAPTS
jgi:hypothetical protein